MRSRRTEGHSVFIEELDEDDLPLVMASQYCDDDYQNYIVTSVEILNNSVKIFGYMQQGYEEDTDVLEEIACGHLEYIIDAIPETEEVQDVKIKKFD